MGGERRERGKREDRRVWSPGSRRSEKGERGERVGRGEREERGLTEGPPEEGGVQVAGVVVALDALLLAHHDIQAVVLRAGGRVLVDHLTQVPPERCSRRHGGLSTEGLQVYLGG